MWDWISKLAELKKEGRRAAVVTLARAQGSSPREEGAKMIVLEEGQFFGTIGGGALEKQALEDVQQCLKESKTRSFEYKLCTRTGQCCGGKVEILVEVLNNNPQVYIFGAGHVGQALCRTLSGTAFNIHVIDEREEWVESENIPGDCVRHRCGWKKFVETALWDAEKTYVMVMTCSHPTDKEIIAEIIKRPAKYIGLIGSKTKWLDFQLELGKNGADAEGLKRVRCPIGEKLAGKAPQEVAVSAAMELLKIYYGNT